MFSLSDKLESVALAELRPTQITVGLREVEEKRREWADATPKKRLRATAELLFPVVIGPKSRRYILDHHHLALALLRLGGDPVVRVGEACDLSALSPDDFWVYLDHRSWVHCYDASGVRRGFDAIPSTFEAMRDDPYRSLASAVRKLGGFAKPDEPFLEFLWANFFRNRIGKRRVRDEFARALAEALELARRPVSSHLPGWSGAA